LRPHLRRPLSAAALLAAIVLSCAKQAPPPGGPLDRTPPAILNAEPESGTTGVKYNSPLSLTFSESMVHDDVERALDIFPAPANPPDLRWKGETLIITPDTAWDSNQTYIVTLQSDAADQHGNRLSQSLQLAFSTGRQIDSGMIRGTVLRTGRPARDVFALCYRLSGSDPDPEVDTADYIVRTDSLGQYQFGFLSPGNYRVFGLDDRDRDWLWYVGSEAIAVPGEDAILRAAGDTADLPPMTLVPLDTVAPALRDCRAVSPRYIEIDFDQSVDSARLTQFQVAVHAATGVQNATTLIALDSTSSSVFAAFAEPLAPGAHDLIATSRARPDRQPREDSCTLEIPDRWERALGSPFRVFPDTLRPPPAPVRAAILEFQQPLAGVADSSITLGLIGDSARAPAQTDSGPFSVRIHIPDSLQLEGPLEVRIPAGAIVGASGGNWPADSAISLRVPQPFLDSAGEIDVRVPLSARRDSGTYRLGLVPVNQPQSVLWYALDSTHSVHGYLRPGSYLIHLHRDLNGDAHAGYGWPYPFSPSEPVWTYSDTLQVRARFTTELSLPALIRK